MQIQIQIYRSAERSRVAENDAPAAACTVFRSIEVGLNTFDQTINNKQFEHVAVGAFQRKSCQSNVLLSCGELGCSVKGLSPFFWSLPAVTYNSGGVMSPLTLFLFFNTDDQV